MSYKCYIIQFAPPSFERVNIGVVVSDGNHHLVRHVPRRTLVILETIFMPETVTRLPISLAEDWREADYWPEPEDFDTMAYAMSVVKYHSDRPIVSVEDQEEHGGLSLQEFGERMYIEYCQEPRYGKKPRAAATTAANGQER